MKFPVSDEVVQMAAGGLLGDSHIRKKSWMGQEGKKLEGNAHIMIAHGEDRVEYLKWKMGLLGDLWNGVIRERKGKWGITYAAESKSSNKLNPFYELIGKPKRVTRKLLNLLTPLGLAIWYMDDGTLMIEYHKRLDGTYAIKRRRIALCTDCFSLEERYIMQRYFKVVWDIDVSIFKIAGKHRLSMNYTEAKKFVEIVKDYIHPSLMYKIDFNRDRDYRNALPPQNNEE